MKRFFTLFAGFLLLSSGAFAQERWTNLVKNSNCEGEEDPTWSSFWCHEWREPSTQFNGFANIVEDPANPKNHCVKVVVRSEAEADEAGNKIVDQNGNFADWDSQFLIYLTDSVPKDKMIRLRMKVKGEVIDGDLSKQKFATQAHQTPGDYNHYQLFGDIPSKGIENGMDGWTEVFLKDGIKVTGQHVNGDGTKQFFQSVAFNLAKGPHAVLYFDDIRVEVMDEKPTDTSGGLFNFLTNGTESAMEMILPNSESDHGKDSIVYQTFTNFTCREGWDAPKGVRTWDKKARVVEDPIDGKPSLTARSVAYNGSFEKINKVEVKDDEGNTVVDENGQTVYKDEIEVVKCYVRENGDTLLNNNKGYSLDDWATQFFVSSPHKFKSGEKVKVKFEYRASKAVSVDCQMHYGPGDYLHYQMLDNSFSFTEDWQMYDKEFEITGSQAGGTTIAFNINKEKDEVVDYYFRFYEFAVYANTATPEDRTLQSDTIYAQVPAGEEEFKVKIDMTPLVEKLGIEDLTAFLNDNTMRVYTKTIEGEGDDAEITEGLQGDLQATTGVFIDKNGSWIDEEQGINLYFPEEDIEGNVVNLSVSQYLFEMKPGEPIRTQLYFDNHGWYYHYDLTLFAPEDYEAAMGVSTIKAQPKTAGIIYDLTGRQVTKATKGLYIKDGKKFFVK